MKMSCRQCRGASMVIDSRCARWHGEWIVRRRRRCKSCGHRWTTRELEDQDLPERQDMQLLRSHLQDALQLLLPLDNVEEVNGNDIGSAPAAPGA
jgi:hypothetical protein